MHSNLKILLLLIQPQEDRSSYNHATLRHSEANNIPQNNHYDPDSISIHSKNTLKNELENWIALLNQEKTSIKEYQDSTLQNIDAGVQEMNRVYALCVQEAEKYKKSIRKSVKEQNEKILRERKEVQKLFNVVSNKNWKDTPQNIEFMKGEMSKIEPFQVWEKNEFSPGVLNSREYEIDKKFHREIVEYLVGKIVSYSFDESSMTGPVQSSSREDVSLTIPYSPRSFMDNPGFMLADRSAEGDKFDSNVRRGSYS